MCTVTLLPTACGYLLGMNRDEQLARSPSLPAAAQAIRGRSVLCPTEIGGGTWVGVNDQGVSFALLNWYQSPHRVAGAAVSRGLLVRSLLPETSPTSVEMALANFPLVWVNPFRLVTVFPAERAVVESRWDLSRLDQMTHRWAANIWISSGFDEAGAHQSRREVFARALGGRAGRNISLLRQMHRCHRSGPGPYSICMHREEAATVSYSEIVVREAEARLAFTPGAPCSTAPLPAVALRLRPGQKVI